MQASIKYNKCELIEKEKREIRIMDFIFAIPVNTLFIRTIFMLKWNADALLQPEIFGNIQITK